MKRTLTLFAAILLLAVGAAAQKLSYQAVVRNSANELVYDATVSVSLKILAADGVTVQYAETQTTTTNQNGLLTLIIGEHPTGSYSLANVVWTDASIRTDITLPSGDVVSNTMPVTAVPYALYADGAGGNLDQVQSNWTETNTASKAYIQNKPTIPTVPTNVSAFQNDAQYVTQTQLDNAGYITSYTETDPQFSAWDKDYNDLTNKPTIPTVPTNVSAFQNDAGYLTSYTETDPQFNAWDKDYNDLTNKPNIPVVNNATLTLKQGNTTLGTFTANASTDQEIEIPTQAIPDQVKSDWNATTGPAEILNKPTIPTVPTNVSAFQNDAHYITVNEVPVQVQSDWAETNTASTAYIQNKPVLFSGNYSDLTGAPTSVSAFQNDANYITINQVPAQVQSDWSETNTASTAYIQNKPVLFSGNYSDLTGAPTSVSAFQNDANYITINQVPAQVQSDWSETNTSSTAYIQNKPAIPTSVSQLTNDVHYITVNEVPVQVQSDWAETNTASTAYIQNKPVLFSGNYSDLTGAPTSVSAFQNDANYITINQVPVQVQSDWAETNTASTAYIQNKPAIPVVNNATLTLKQGGATLGTFTANASVNQEIEIPTQAIPDQVNADWNATDGPAKILNKPTIPTVPTSVSAFQNDAGYLTSYTETDPQFNAWDKDYNDLTNKPTIPTVPTNVSAFQNDAGYLTSYTETDPQFNAWDKDYNDLTNKPTIPTVPTSVSAFQNDAGYLTSYTETDPQFNAWDKDYNDLTNKPTIPTVPTNVSAFQNDAGYLTSYTETDPQFNAWDKDYNDLTNKPTIPTVPTNVSAFQNDAGYLTSYTETQSLADVTANGNSAGNRQLKNVSDPTDAQDAVTKSYLAAQTETITASIQQQLANLADQYQQQLGALTSSFQHQLDSLGGVIEAQQHLLDSLINGGSTPIPPTPAAPTATTSPATDLTQTSATLNGSISNPDNVTVTAQGFEWKATEGGTYAAVNATGETMTYSLTGLTASTGYTYRAFVTTANGTSYGEEVTFTTLSAAVIDDKSCPEAQTVTDHEGNVYATVQIGNQCWMRDNLRTTTSPSTGTYLIPAADANYTYTGKQARWFNNDSATYAPMNYGLLYNWNAAVDTFNTAYGETSVNTSSSNAVSVTFNGHRRGICPAGWHLPSDAEWTTLTDYVSSQSEFQCGGNSNYIAKALASTEGWNTYTSNCAVGNDLTANNATGFSAVPAGYCVGSSFYYAGTYANFWSATRGENGPHYAYYRNLFSPDARVYGYDDGKYYGYSVRCLRDESGNTAQTQPTATTGTATNITENSATLSGSVTNPDNVTIASKGFEYKALGSTAYTQVAATGTDDSFSATVSNLAPSTEYSYRAFVTYDNNTVYGGEVTFTTLCGNVQLSIQATKTSICPGVESVTLTASGAETYTWSTNETGASITITAPGHYTVVGQDANGCEGFTDIYIYEEVCAPVPQVATLEPTHDPELYYHYLSGQIVSDNGSAVTECGFCISDGDQEPTYPNSAMSVQNWTGNTFNKVLHVSDFTEGVTYYVRAYARNSAGTGYGETVTIKWPKHPVVNLSDNDITNVTDNSAAATASVELRNCTGIVAAGFCWREIENNVYPTLEDSHTVEAGSTSDYSFSSAITGLTQGIEYIVRAYVTTDENLTVYSGSSYFTTKCGAPTFELSACGDDCVEVTYDLTNTGAMDGIGAYIQYREAGASVNSWYEEYAFSSPYNISYFLPNTEYEIQVGSHCDYESVSWSESKYFTVPYGSSAPTPAVTSAIPCTITSGHPAQTAALGYTASGANHGLETVTSDGKINSVTDYDGNEYPVVQIGSQCWLAENLRTRRYSDGTAITPGGSSTSATTAYYYDYSSSNIPLADRGYLYNWPAVMRNSSSSSVTPSGVQGICPSGWHVPSDAEWTQLTDYVSGQSEYVCGGNTSYIAKALASKTYWNTSSGTCYVGDTPSANNATGFGALPAGGYYNDGYYNFGNSAYFWSATEASSGYAWNRYLDYSDANVYRNSLNENVGYSVRCLRD